MHERNAIVLHGTWSFFNRNVETKVQKGWTLFVYFTPNIRTNCWINRVGVQLRHFWCFFVYRVRKKNLISMTLTAECGIGCPGFWTRKKHFFRKKWEKLLPIHSCATQHWINELCLKPSFYCSLISFLDWSGLYKRSAGSENVNKL